MNATTPQLDTPPDSEAGRGLLLVTALADRWGTEPYPPGGKTVWADLSLGSDLRDGCRHHPG